MAVKISPKNANAYCNRGIAYLKKSSLEQAVYDLTRAVEIDPDFTEAYSNRALANFLKEEYDRSWKDVHRAKELGSEVSQKFLDELSKASPEKNEKP